MIGKQYCISVACTLCYAQSVPVRFENGRYQQPNHEEYTQLINDKAWELAQKEGYITPKDGAPTVHFCGNCAKSIYDNLSKTKRAKKMDAPKPKKVG